MTREWTPARIATLRRMAAAGYTDAEIAAHLRTTSAAVQGQRRRLAIAPGLSPEHKAALARITYRLTARRLVQT